MADTAVDIFELHGAAVIAVKTQEMRIAPDGTGGNLHEIPYLIRWRGTRDYLMQQDGCLLPRP